MRLVKGSKYGGPVAKIKYNIAFNTFIFSFDAKEMLLPKKNDFFLISQIFGIRQNVASVSFHYCFH